LDLQQLGATQFLNSSKKDFAKEHSMEFDLIISTIDASQHEFPINDYLSMLNVNGTFNQCGLPNEDLPAVQPFTFAANGGHLSGSHIGNKTEALEMLDIAAKSGVKSWIEEIPISEKGCHEALTRLDKGDVRYRFVLTGIQEHFKSK
jgi:alcohol dehydrogenase (NADP+)